MKTSTKPMFVGLMLFVALTASAGGFKLKTAKPVGQTLSVAINAGLPLTLTWGDGTTEELYTTGQLQDITIKDAALTVSTEKDITSLYLADNELTELNVAASAAKLRRLICPNNQLKTLNVGACPELVTLDCQGNELSTLSIVSTVMEELNVADNKLSANGLRNSGNMVSLVCGGNKFTDVNYLTSMVDLESLFCQDNQITSLALTKLVKLRNLVASGNRISTLNTGVLENLQNIWVSGNRLKSLDLAKAAKLEGLVVAENQLTEILWTRSCSSTFKYMDLSNNGLFFNSFPTIYNQLSQKYSVDGAVGPQEPFQLLNDIDVNVRSEALKTYFYQNAWNTSTQLALTLTDGDGTELVADEDYTYNSSLYRFTFLKPHTDVVITATSKNYPGVVLTSVPFNVIDPAGIEGAEVVSELTIENADVYDLQGRKVSVAKASQLLKGIYVVNGKKIIMK